MNPMGLYNITPPNTHTYTHTLTKVPPKYILINKMLLSGFMTLRIVLVFLIIFKI